MTLMCRLMLNLHARAPRGDSAPSASTLDDTGYMMTTDLGFAPANTARTHADEGYEEIELQRRSVVAKVRGAVAW